MTIVAAGVAAIALMVPIGVIWAAGFAVRLRKDGVVRREHAAVASALAAAAAEGRVERARIVAGLRQQVVEQAGQVVTAAETGHPDEVLVAARAALGAMRELLSALEAGPPRPVPTEQTPLAASA